MAGFLAAVFLLAAAVLGLGAPFLLLDLSSSTISAPFLTAKPGPWRTHYLVKSCHTSRYATSLPHLSSSRRRS